MPQEAQDMFERLVWQRDRMLLDDLVFRLEHYKSEDWNGGEHFMFYKIKGLIDQYAHYFRRRCDFRPKRILELGTYDGGSVAFWHELFRPQKHVAVDVMKRKDSPYFRRYVESRGLSDRMKTFWKIDQADKSVLQGLIAREFDGPLDLVIDDASHLYRPTLASFEALFPALAPGGLYVIEDWAWGHWRDFIAPDHPWAGETPLTRLVIELIEATGTSTQLIANVTVYQGFVSVERGPQTIDDPASFTLASRIVKRPSSGESAHTLRPQARILSRLARKFRFGRSRRT